MAAGNEAGADRLRKSADELWWHWKEEWSRSLPGLLEPINRLAVGPVVEKLLSLNVKRVIFSPNRALHVFPLHGCQTPDGGYLADEFEVVYTPGFSLLDRCEKRQRRKRNRLLLVQNPAGNLPFAEAEGLALQRLYPGARVLDFASADRTEFLKRAQSSHVLHYSGHSRFDPNEPLDSALVLCGTQDPVGLLSLRDVFCSLRVPQNMLSILNGCESGMLRPDRTDDHVNLPTGFLYAGAASVIGSLWTVFDLSSALLMHRFHQEWRVSPSPAAALRAAQRWLRDDIRSGPCLMKDVLPRFLENVDDVYMRQRCEMAARHHAKLFPASPPFASPVHWAPFIAMGLAYPLKLPN